VQILGSDERPGGIAYVAPGERVSVEQLFHLSLVASANNATIALARSTGLAPEAFVEKMNEMAAAIGMHNAHFTEPSGLDPANVASARDVALLIKTALLRPEIRDVVVQDVYRFRTLGGREAAVRSTDELLGSFLTRPPYVFFGGKTGHLDEAGYCLAAAASNLKGDRVIAVVLGSATKEQRFREVKALLHWAFDVYDWP
jgi:D-alanyl-D-alanine carboxypeptidase (penicillin-binding protein 5/6)